MLTSIHPLGERSRNNRWWRTVAAHLVGTTLAGGFIGSFAGAIGVAADRAGVPRSVLAAAVIALALYGVVVEAGGERWAVMSVHRQVNEDWIGTYRGWVYGFGFGVQLGVGVATIVTTALVYLALALAVLTMSIPAGASIGLVFGAGRGATVLAMAGVDHPESLNRRFGRLHALFPHVRRASMTTLTTSAALVALAL